MDKNELLKKCMEALQRAPLVPGYLDLINEIQESLEVKTKDRVVIKMDGGVVNEVIADRPMDVLKIEEAGDMDEEDLLDMYPDKPWINSGETEVFAVIREAECDPEAIEDEYRRCQLPRPEGRSL